MFHDDGRSSVDLRALHHSFPADASAAGVPPRAQPSPSPYWCLQVRAPSELIRGYNHHSISGQTGRNSQQQAQRVTPQVLATGGLEAYEADFTACDKMQQQSMQPAYPADNNACRCARGSHSPAVFPQHSSCESHAHSNHGAVPHESHNNAPVRHAKHTRMSFDNTDLLVLPRSHCHKPRDRAAAAYGINGSTPSSGCLDAGVADSSAIEPHPELALEVSTRPG